MDRNDFTTEAIKAAPPTTVSTLSLMGASLSDMVYIMTIVYIVVQIICLLYKTFKKEGA